MYVLKAAFLGARNIFFCDFLLKRTKLRRKNVGYALTTYIEKNVTHIVTAV